MTLVLPSKPVNSKNQPLVQRLEIGKTKLVGIFGEVLAGNLQTTMIAPGSLLAAQPGKLGKYLHDAMSAHFEEEEHPRLAIADIVRQDTAIKNTEIGGEALLPKGDIIATRRKLPTEIRSGMEGVVD